MSHGKVKWFSQAKGFGFLEQSDEFGGKDVYVHYTSITSPGSKVLSEGQNVEFDVKDTERGLEATKVLILEEMV